MKKQHLNISVDLSLPLEAVTQTFSILAKRGMGKTYTACVMAEEMVSAGLHICAIDPIGVWFGLRSSASGKRAGLPVHIIGGDHGDLPLNSDSGVLFADLVMEENINVVLDLSLLRKGEQDKFVTAFAERLYHKNRKPIHVFVDEADAFAPQRPMPDQRRMLGAMEDLVRRGRARGIGLTLVTQRSAVLNKNVLTQTEALICLRTIAPQDREAIDAWIEAHGTREEREKMIADLASLPVGTGYFWSPGWLDVFKKIRIRERETFDSSSTPKVGGNKAEPPKILADVEIEKLKSKLSAVIERAKSEDPKELRKRISELERELAHKPKTREIETKIQTETEIKEIPVLKTHQLRVIERIVTRIENHTKKMQACVLELNISKCEPKRVHEHVSPPTKILDHAMPKQIEASKQSNGSIQLRSGERRMLQTLAMRPHLPLTKQQLGTLSGFTPSGGTFMTYFGTLRRHGLIVGGGGGAPYQLTRDGLDILGSDTPEAPKNAGDVARLWKNSLRAGEVKMLDCLLDNHPNGLTKEELGDMTGFTSSGGTFMTYLGVLRRNGLAEIENGQVKAGEALFLV